MVTRIVRLTITAEKVAEFVAQFNETYAHIRSFPGCTYLSLQHDLDQPHVMITFSTWNGPEDLENYRNSELFKSTWAKVKPLFGGAPTAFTMVEDVPNTDPEIN